MTQAKFFENTEKEDYYEEEEELRRQRKPGEAPDGGWGWLVVLGAGLCCIILQGLFSSYVILQEEVEETMKQTDTSSMSPGLVMEACSLICGPIAAALLSKYGCRRVTIGGIILAVAGQLISTKMPNLVGMQLTYGAVTGFGLGMVYLPSIMMVTVWFDHRRAFATGLSMMGAGIGYFVFQAIYDSFLKTNDWKNTVVLAAAVSLHCAVGGALYRPLTHAKPNRMKRGVIQRGAIMKALIAEKERQRTISNGSLDNCIITKDNRLIKLEKIDLRNKSSSYINRLKETFGFSSRSLNRSKNSLVVPKVVVDPIYKPKPSPKPHQKVLQPKHASSPPTPKRDSGCGDSLESPKFKSRSYEALPVEDTWDTQLVVKLPSPSRSAQETAKVSLSDRVLSNLDRPRRREEERFDASFLSNNASPMGSGLSINMRVVSGSGQSGAKNIVIPIQGNVMTVPSSSVEMSQIYEEEEEEKNCKMCRKLNKWFHCENLKSPTFVLFLFCSIVNMTGYVIPIANLPRKAMSMGIGRNEALFLISIFWVANMIGRFALGWIADRPWARSVHMNNVLVLFAAILSFFIHSFTDQGLLSFYAAFFGFFTAGFVTLRSIMMIELFGKEMLSIAFGQVIFVQGIAMLIGSLIADSLPGDGAFHVAGACLLLAGVVGFFLHRLKFWEDHRPKDSSSSLQIVGIEELAVPETLHVENCESTI